MDASAGTFELSRDGKADLLSLWRHAKNMLRRKLIPKRYSRMQNVVCSINGESRKVKRILLAISRHLKIKLFFFFFLEIFPI